MTEGEQTTAEPTGTTEADRRTTNEGTEANDPTGDDPDTAPGDGWTNSY